MRRRRRRIKRPVPCTYKLIYRFRGESVYYTLDIVVPKTADWVDYSCVKDIDATAYSIYNQVLRYRSPNNKLEETFPELLRQLRQRVREMHADKGVITEVSESGHEYIVLPLLLFREFSRSRQDCSIPLPFKPYVISHDSPGLYGFVHPTKNGGTVLEDYLSHHYSPFIRGSGHENTAASVVAAGKIPILTVRDPLDRFFSIFYYWKNGAITGPFRRSDSFQPVCETPNEFVDCHRRGDDELLKQLDHGFTWDVHFAPQSDWITPCEWGRTIVIKYSAVDLDLKIYKLLKDIGICKFKVSFPFVNRTRKEEDVFLSDDNLEWVLGKYKSDFDLWHAVNHTPDKFLKAIN